MKSGAGLKPGLDFRSNGGYIVAPPSLHESGKRYRWLDGKKPTQIALADIPQWLHTLMTKKPISHAGIAEGTRNDTLFRKACELRGQGLSESEIFSVISEVNKMQCNPPLPESEVQKACEQAAKYPAGREEQREFYPLAATNFNALPPFPVDVLPPPLQEFVLAACKSVQVSPGMIAPHVLACVATAAQGKFRVRISDDFSVPLNLYAITVAPPGERKSSAAKIAGEPLMAYALKANEDRAKDILKYNTDLKVAHERIANAEKDLVKAKTQEAYEKIQGDLDDYRDALILLENSPVKNLTLFTTDATPEKLAILMRDNQERMAIVTGEPDALTVAAGIRYGEVKNLHLFLEAWSGEPVQIHRVSAERDVFLKHPLLTVSVGAQPEYLQTMMGDTELHGRGFIDRFLYSFPPGYWGTLKYRTESIPPETWDLYRETLYRLLEIEGAPRDIQLSPEADASAEAFHNWLQKHSEDDIRGWCSKLESQVFRLAGILHAATWWDEAADRVLEEETMRGAIALGHYFLEHAKAAFEGTTPAETDALYIWQRMIDSGKITFTVAEVQSLCKKSVKAAKRMNPALDCLVDHGYLIRRRTKESRQKERTMYTISDNAKAYTLSEAAKKA